MLSILINWLYMGGLVFLTGAALTQGYMRCVKIADKKADEVKFSIGHILFAGILGTTLYAQIFSLFYRVNVEANIVLLLLLGGYALWQRRYIIRMAAEWKESFSLDGIRLPAKAERWLPTAIIFLMTASYALCSAGPAKLIDTDWYHAQTIRWIEEYGCVKGLANLFPSLGYNNAGHYFDALFSMKWAFGQSMRGSGGFFGVIIFLHGFLRVLQWKHHSRHLADALAVWEMAYSIIVTAFFTDPYVDTLPNILVLFVFTQWLALLEEKKEDTVELAFYSLLAVFAAVCKMSVVMSVLLAIYPAYLLIRQRKLAAIGLYLGIGAVIVLPFLITNVITTGFLVYLLSALDLFNVRWKIDPAILEYSVDSMIAFARMPLVSMEEALNSGLKWIPVWFKAESISHRILYIAILIFVLYDMIHTIIRIMGKKDVEFWMLWPRICVCFGLIYWFFTIPQVKYCWSFLIFPAAVIPVYYLEKKRKVPGTRIMMAAALLILLMYSGFYSLRTLGYMKDGLLHYPLMQADYVKYDFEPVMIDGHTFYIRGDAADLAAGYHMFPYLDNKDDMERLVVGESLGDGFYLEEKN